MNKDTKKELITINGAAKIIDVKRSFLNEWILEGKIESRNGMISLKTIESIKKIIDSHISLEFYLKNKSNERFNYKFHRDREKFIDFLETNNFFGLKIYYADEFPYSYDKSATLYFENKDINKLDDYSQVFFKYFGLSEYDKCMLIIRDCQRDTTRKILEKYVDSIETFTPSVTNFIKTASNINIYKIREKDVNELTKHMSYNASKDYMISFLVFAKKELSLNWGKIERKANQTQKNISAYPYNIFSTIAKTIFCEQKIKDNQILQKSFEKSKNFETWLFLSIHYVCGWRSGDICENWPSPNDETLSRLDINFDTLKEDILGEKINPNIYYELGVYIEKSIELSAIKPHKTKKGYALLAPIDNNLKLFFGRMALISAYHINRSNEGKLLSHRTHDYLNYIQFKYLFGDEVYNLIGKKNLSSRRLNKSYLQSIEDRARKDGAGTLTAYTLASFARNHADTDTVATYLHDHGLDGETADVVLSMMLNRGVFGTIKYKELLSAFPNAFNKLTAEEQSKIMSECEVSAYELEVMSSDMLSELTLKEKFAEGNTKESLSILNAMFEIAQGFGKAKDIGIHCKKRALGEVCDSPLFESCLANVCPHLIFTEAGIKSLIKVINQYKEKAITTGNPKYETILDNVIKPAYKNILIEISKRMSSMQKETLKKAIGKIYEEYTSPN